jgi:hypothetical protein
MRDWRKTKIASDRTHHLLDDRPLYSQRFDEVLAFHSPGLAPVLRDRLAWHIDLQGEAAYEPRFQRTFGFYGDRAAVATEAGWWHILPDGSPLYPERYAWCGNFQDARCTVRAADDAYMHIDLDGRPVYTSRWRYAGDYRDGVAVVQAGDGRSTHVDSAGEPVHGSWFLDLDVYHKGFARARDEQGWMHIDLAGAPVYQRRFSAVEPFYNGQARVEREDGGLEVIDEAGHRLVELRPARRGEFADLSADRAGVAR